ncbi:hypothetical protein V2A60_008358 [Cordyceps javanica]
MTATEDYETTNRAAWDERVPFHVASSEYQVEDYISDPNFIGNVVQFDRPFLGDITGFHCVHLQCHIGTDALSLARLGAASVTGLDFSGEAVTAARRLADATAGSGGEKLKFVQSSVQQAWTVLPRDAFELVFVSIGSLCYIPKIKEWARVVSGLLKQGGRLFVRDFHPVLLSLGDGKPDEMVIDFPYFEREEPMIMDRQGTYVEWGDYVFTSTRRAVFNHGIGEIVQALLDVGMRLTMLKEHQSAPLMGSQPELEADAGGEYSMKNRPWRLPLSYTLLAVKE